ncbi:toxin-antitoxin system YwqK family antitoxin [Zobellia uliginosa]|uniref:toxin-antitoxin system YwqK family antitoxin n=1 Tax=Zobellia uliginosa TaxID=143224 RepID=UPI0026E1E63C|nr:hypothetical protein [Zobellia uliginosa]MDO6519066.1 hypothetical protein [Zobellia uliginosa]
MIKDLKRFVFIDTMRLHITIHKILFCLVFFGIFGCLDKNLIEYEYYKTGEIKSKVKINSDSIPFGLYEEYYKSGEPKIRATYTNGRILDTVIHFYKNGSIKEKGLLKEGKKYKWWKSYDSLGNFKKVTEYVIIDEGRSSYENQIKTMENGVVNLKKSSFFELNVPDTLFLGKNLGKIDYYSNLKADKKYILVIVENQYSDTEVRRDTFSEDSNSLRFGIYAHKTGSKRIVGEIIEKLVDTTKTNKDSLELVVNEYRKYFEKDVFVQ